MSNAMTRHVRLYDYHIAILCALPLERQAMEACLDFVYRPKYQVPYDPMIYTLGRIGKHAIAITSLLTYGNSQSAAAAVNIKRSFPNIRTCLMVGIGGGVPYSAGKDIHLGDVVVSVPQSGNSGILSYDCGKDIEGIGFQLNSYADTPPQSLLLAVSQLQDGSWPKLTAMVEELVSSGAIDESFRYPGRHTDVLFEPDAVHIPSPSFENGCYRSCSHLPQRQRIPREDDHPVVYHGLIATGNGVIKNATRCRELSQKYGILCFEMEAAGVSKSLDCLSIRGISDYSDSHKSGHWQRYAALVAACYAKELLLWVSPLQFKYVVHESPTEVICGMPYIIRCSLISCLYEQANDIHRYLTEEDCREQYLLVAGPTGCGKTSIVSNVVHDLHSDAPVVWLSAGDPESFKFSIIKLAISLEQSLDYDNLDETLLELLDIIERSARKPWVLVVDDSEAFEEIVSKLDRQNELSPVVYRRVVIIGRGKFGRMPQSQFPIKLVQLPYFRGYAGHGFLQKYLADDSLFEGEEQCSELIDMMADTPIYLAQCAAFMLEQWIPISELIERLNSVDLGTQYVTKGFLREGIPEGAVKLHALILEVIKAVDPDLSLFSMCAVYVGVRDIPIGQIPLQQKSLNILINMLVRYNVAKRTRNRTLEFCGVTHYILMALMYDNSAEMCKHAVDNIMQLTHKSDEHDMMDVYRLAFHSLSIVDAAGTSEEDKMTILIHLQGLFVKERLYKEILHIANRVREVYNRNDELKLKFFKEAQGCALNMVMACKKLGRYGLARHIRSLLAPLTSESDPEFQRINRSLHRFGHFPSHGPAEHDLEQEIKLYVPFDFPKI